MAETIARGDRYGLVGKPVSHSRSPMIHQYFARQTGHDITYELIEANAGEFETAVRGFAAAGAKGMNVTVPHKEAAFALCDTHGAEARAAGAVNTITFRNGKLHGDNTDGIGFMRDLVDNHGCNPAGLDVLVLGAGGAARGIILPLLSADCARLVVANRTEARAEALRDALPGGDRIEVRRFDELGELGVFDVVINATSAGLGSEEIPFPPGIVGRGTFCYDLVYGTSATPFVEWARAAGAKDAVSGWGMLVEQAAEAFRIWRGVMPDTTELAKPAA